MSKVATMFSLPDFIHEKLNEDEIRELDTWISDYAAEEYYEGYDNGLEHGRSETTD